MFLSLGFELGPTLGILIATDFPVCFSRRRTLDNMLSDFYSSLGCTASRKSEGVPRQGT